MNDESLFQELKDWQNGKIRFPYNLSTELLQFLNETLNDDHNWSLMRIRQELGIREHGRFMPSIPMIDEKGESAMTDDGKIIAHFTYTLGQGRKGLPEILCFYPSTSIGYGINNLCDKMEAEALESDKSGVYRVKGCFEADPELEFILIQLEGSERELAAEKYACQCEDDEPLFLAVAPYPDGSFCLQYIPKEYMHLVSVCDGIER